MFGDSFIRFLHEQEGKADRQKVLALSALVGSSVLAQVMFAGVAQAYVCETISCSLNCPGTCVDHGCDALQISRTCTYA
jgi:hypothetical protein